MNDSLVPPWAMAMSVFLAILFSLFAVFIGAEDCVEVGLGRMDVFDLTCHVPIGSDYVPVGQRPAFFVAFTLLISLALAPVWTSLMVNRFKRPNNSFKPSPHQGGA